MPSPTSPPTNQQILDAARDVYGAYQPLVDLHTRSGVTYVQEPSGKQTVGALNAYDWKSQEVGPIAPTARQVLQAPTMAAAVAASHDTPDVATLVYGVSESAQFILGEEGGVGVGFGLGNQMATAGTAYLAGKLGLDIDAAVNLQIGIWAASPAGLAGEFYGLEVNLDLEVGVSLGVFLTPSLKFYGFGIGIGAGLGGGVTAVDGYTWVF